MRSPCSWFCHAAGQRRAAAHEQLFSAVPLSSSFCSVNPGCISDPERTNRRDRNGSTLAAGLRLSQCLSLSLSLSLSPSRRVRHHTSLHVI